MVNTKVSYRLLPLRLDWRTLVVDVLHMCLFVPCTGTQWKRVLITSSVRKFSEVIMPSDLD